MGLALRCCRLSVFGSCWKCWCCFWSCFFCYFWCAAASCWSMCRPVPPCSRALSHCSSSVLPCLAPRLSCRASLRRLEAASLPDKLAVTNSGSSKQRLMLRNAAIQLLDGYGNAAGGSGVQV